MGTRGFIGVGTLDACEGWYWPADSRPSDLGPLLWRRIQALTQDFGALGDLGSALAALGELNGSVGARTDGVDPELNDWAYLFEPAGAAMTVFASAFVEAEDGSEAKAFVEVAGTVLNAETQPDWKAMEKAGALASAPFLKRRMLERFGPEAAASYQRELDALG